MLSSDWDHQFVIERIDAEPQELAQRLVTDILLEPNVQQEQQPVGHQ